MNNLSFGRKKSRKEKVLNSQELPEKTSKDASPTKKIDRFTSQIDKNYLRNARNNEKLMRRSSFLKSLSHSVLSIENHNQNTNFTATTKYQINSSNLYDWRASKFGERNLRNSLLDSKFIAEKSKDKIKNRKISESSQKSDKSSKNSNTNIDPSFLTKTIISQRSRIIELEGRLNTTTVQPTAIETLSPEELKALIIELESANRRLRTKFENVVYEKDNEVGKLNVEIFVLRKELKDVRKELLLLKEQNKEQQQNSQNQKNSLTPFHRTPSNNESPSSTATNPKKSDHHPEEKTSVIKEIQPITNLTPYVNRYKRIAISDEPMATSPLQTVAKLDRLVIIPKTAGQKQYLYDCLIQNHFFRKLQKTQLMKIIDCMERRELLEKGVQLIEQGTEGTHLYVLKRGQVAITTKADGVVASLSSGSIFGELAILYNCKRTATVTTSTENTVLYQLDRASFKIIATALGQSREKQKFSFLKGVPKLKFLPDEKLRKIADCLEEDSFANNECIIKQGESGEVFYIIEEGQVKVTKNVHTSATALQKDPTITSLSSNLNSHNNDKTKKLQRTTSSAAGELIEPSIEKSEIINYANGKSERLVAKLGKGMYFGEIALQSEDVRTANVYADGFVKLLALDRKDFTKLIGSLDDNIQKKRNSNRRQQQENDKKLQRQDSLLSSVREDKNSENNHQVNSNLNSKTNQKLTLPNDYQDSKSRSKSYQDLSDPGERADNEPSSSSKSKSNDLNEDNLTYEQTQVKKLKDDILIAEKLSDVSLSQLRVLKMLGQGGFGDVQLVYFVEKTVNNNMSNSGVGGSSSCCEVPLQPLRPYALKSIQKCKIVQHGQQRHIMDEKNILTIMDSDFIIKLRKTFKDSKRVYF